MNKILALVMALGALLPPYLAAEPPANPVLASERPIYRPPPDFQQLIDRKQFADAWRYALAECERKPQAPDGWLLRCKVRQAEEKYAEALQEAQEAVRRFPRSAAALETRAGCHTDQTDFAAALQDVDSAIELDRANSWLRTKRGSLLVGLERDSEAIEVFRTLPEPRSRSVVEPMIVALARLGDHREAVQVAARHAADLPRDAQARLLLAAALHEAGDTEGAMREATQAMKLDPTAPQPREARATMFYLLGRVERALADQGEAIRLAKSDVDRADFLFTRAKMHAEQKNPAGVMADAAAAIESNPSHPGYWLMRADYLTRDHDFAAARRDLTTVIDGVRAGTMKLVKLTLPVLLRRRATVNLLLRDRPAYDADLAEADRIEQEEASMEARRR